MLDDNYTASPILDLFESLNFSPEIVEGKKIIKEYNSTSDELNSLYKGIGLRDISFRGIIELKGKDVLDFLHRVATNSTKDLSREKLTHTFFTNEKGRVIDLTTLLNFDDYQLLVCSSENKLKIKSWIDKYTITDDVKATDVYGKYSLLELIGPQVDSFLMLLCGNVVNNIPQDSFKVIHAEGMLFFLTKLLQFDGEVKYWIISDPENGRKLIQFMLENKGPYDFNLVGEDAYNIYRIEKGFPEVPNEINGLVNPHEVNLTKFIDFKKGCYIGQEVIARLDTYNKVQRTLMGIKFNDEIGEEKGSILEDEEGREAGIITSATYSEKLNAHIGLALVRKAHAEEGKELITRNESNKLHKISVINLPFKK